MKSELQYRIFVVDDHPVVLTGLKGLLEPEGEFAICGSAVARNEAIAQLAKTECDLVLVDVGVDGFSGLELIQQLKIDHPGLKVLCFSVHEETFFAERALRAGALGYVMKTEPGSVVVKAIRAVLSGQVYLSEKMGRRILCRFAGAPAGNSNFAISQLSNRELQVIHHIGESRNNQQIARLMSVSVKTIEAHRSKIKGKLSLRTTCDLIRFATNWVEHEASFVD